MQYFKEVKKRMLDKADIPFEQLSAYRGVGDNAIIDENGIVTFLMKNNQPSLMYWITTEDRRLLSENAHGEFTSISRIEEGTRSPIHRHDFIELGYVIEGTARQIFSGKEYAFPEGSFWLSDRNCIHQDMVLPENLFTCFFSMPADFFEGRFLQLIENEEVREFIRNALMMQRKMKQFISFMPSEPCPEAVEVLRQMAVECTEQKTGWTVVLQGLLLRLLALLVEHYSVGLTNQTRLTLSGTIVSEVMRYIGEHYADVTLQDLADTFHYSPDFISRLIKESTGVSYSDYVQKVRIKKAKQLLEWSSDSIDSVIEAVGYKNRRFFYSIFAEETGMTPKAYREAKRKRT